MSQRLIITADDYGLCDSVNQAIEECLSAGSVRATCVMANMPDYRAAESLRRKFPQTSLGIHLNVTQGKPVLPCEQIPSLLNGNGSFCKPSEFRRRWWAGRVKLNELQAELRAQFDRLVEITGPLDFWNTHQNSHVFPGLFHAFVNLGRELKIPAMRCHRRMTVPHGSTPLRYNLKHPQYWLKGQVISWLCLQAQSRGTIMPDARLYTPGFTGTRESLEKVIENIPWHKVRRAVEIVTHPATAVNGKLFGELTESRVREYKILRDPTLINRLRQASVEPSNFDSLKW
jgi:chitin disaccharide deacetylase